MSNPWTREQIDNWVADFCQSDALRPFAPATREFAREILAHFLAAACEHRGLEPAEIEEPDCRAALLEHTARLQLPDAARAESPALVADFLAQLEAEGRLGGGRVLGAFVRALGPAFEVAAGGKSRPITRPGSRIGRNDPCPCGSGRKYKKCCMRED